MVASEGLKQENGGLVRQVLLRQTLPLCFRQGLARWTSAGVLSTQRYELRSLLARFDET